MSGPANNDFHIPISRGPDDTEFDGIVVEMIPQDRDPGWTAAKLRRVAREARPVVVRERLFYDNKDEVDEDPDDVKGGEPKQFSLWEIHPVSEFYVCVTANKKSDAKNVKEPQWRRLEKMREWAVAMIRVRVLSFGEPCREERVRGTLQCREALSFDSRPSSA